MDPTASRETLDHSIMYIVAIALQDGEWHHVRSYAPERAQRPDTVALWHKIRTIEDSKWTMRYHATDPGIKAFGGRVIITMKDGSTIVDELAVANAHTLGATPWQRADYVRKFEVRDQWPARQRRGRGGSCKRRSVCRSMRAHELIELTIALPTGDLGVG